MIARTDTRRPFTVTLVLLIAVAWLALTMWSLSPYARYLNHEVLEDAHFALSAEYLTLLSIFVSGWVLMTAAMMLPTSLPLITLFLRMTHRRPDQARLAVLLISGYLAIWAAFGVVAHASDLLIHEAVHQFPWLEANAWAISAGVLALAGVYQFSPLKYACLDACRSPLSFVAARWQGKGEGRAAFRLGVQHGLFCLGCCWSLMLLMFALACGNIAWMLGLGAVMAVEKNAAWGRSISAPLGVALLAASAAVVLLR